MILKIEDRAGLLYAKDKGGNLIEAKDAAYGTPYFCPICNCSMHPATTPKGERYFARSAGTQHTNSVCITYEAIKKKHTFAGMDPYTFILSLCRVTPRKDTKRDNQLDYSFLK